MVSSLSRILPRSAKRKQNGWKMENLPSRPRPGVTAEPQKNEDRCEHVTASGLQIDEDDRQSAELDEDETGTRSLASEQEQTLLGMESSHVGRSDDTEAADEATLSVWSAYQRWRVTKIRLGGILNQNGTRPNSTSSFPLVNSIYSSIVGSESRSM